MIVNGEEEEKSCWVTLVTKPSYVPGAIILAHSLAKHKSRYPLLILYTQTLGQEAVRALEAEAAASGSIIPHQVDLLLPRKGQENTGGVAERFVDTYTKLRAFEVYKLGYTRVAFLDADMAVFHNPDEIFRLRLPDRSWLAANHACVCNLDHDAWAPTSWTKGNCAYTPLTGSNQIAAPVTPKSRPTWRLLNGGMFLFYPTEELWDSMMDAFNTSDRLKSYQFPDQDFLADFFESKWTPVSWKYNALKTMRYWHPRLWSDDKVVVVHYIVDKPWEREVSDRGVAGHLGRDGETHRWWWVLYREWQQQRTLAGQEDAAVELMQDLVGEQAPFSEVVPLAQAPGEPLDVSPYP
jgi:inositol 3-alpha-galactosyltransferase